MHSLKGFVIEMTATVGNMGCSTNLFALKILSVIMQMCCLVMGLRNVLDFVSSSLQRSKDLVIQLKLYVFFVSSNCGVLFETLLEIMR